MQLENKTALITGGGRGIGRAIALAFAGEGADICLTARSRQEIEKVADEIRELGRHACALVCNVADHQAVTQTIDTAVEKLGRLDILVNNAGGNFVRCGVADSQPDQWSQVIQSNLLGTYYCCRAALPHLAKTGSGKIINIGSGMGHSARPGNSAYNTAKAGMWMFTRCLAQEVWEQGIDVNELIPGPVFTQLTEDIFKLEKQHPTIPSEYVKTPQECVPLALFLATQPRGGPTGQSFSLARRPL